MSGYNPEGDIGPNFRRDLAFGQQGEQLALLQWDALVQGNAVQEVKRSRFADPVLFVEVEQRPRGRGWRPSGLFEPRSESEWFWFIKPNDIGIVVPKTRLLKAYSIGPPIKGGGFSGDNPTRGFTTCIGCLIGGLSTSGCTTHHRRAAA